jgi:hypothetical protein
MPDDADIYEVELGGEAKNAVSRIVQILGRLGRRDVTPEEALQRALGTELYLLQQASERGTVAVEGKEGRVELNLAA